MATHSIAEIEAQIKAHEEQIDKLKAAAAK